MLQNRNFRYGNLGRGVESAIAHNEDMELVGVFTRRNPENVKVRTADVKVLEASELEHMQDQIDVLVLLRRKRDGSAGSDPQICSG